ncbi:hypothetical protein H311_01507 [Anncaliia algerae PRA109]|nr:hypothetical protein H311_01507 [Anncaliia algerae PRA109]
MVILNLKEKITLLLKLVNRNLARKSIIKVIRQMVFGFGVRLNVLMRENFYLLLLMTERPMTCKKI